ncbi:hypothetical protein [Puniceicoccus vermicola]|uniref:hypothetical protein n=1 Tax=Puniceicoccus vermicola TaxID=388746 RepID=UPI00163A82E8|nr:hypothetical protein [Puniceicoccus vermicola]
MHEESFISKGCILYLINFSENDTLTWFVKINGVPISIELNEGERYIIASSISDSGENMSAKINDSRIESAIIQLSGESPGKDIKYLTIENTSGKDTWVLKQRLVDEEGQEKGNPGFDLLLIDAEDVLVEVDRVEWGS